MKFAATGFAESRGQSRRKKGTEEKFEHLYPNPKEKDGQGKDYTQQKK